MSNVSPNRPSTRSATPQPLRPVEQKKPKETTSEPGPAIRVRPSGPSISVPQPTIAQAESAEYAQMVQVNEALIQSYVEKMRQAAQARGLDLAKTAFIYDVDVTGRTVSVCLACGVEGHDYRPTNVRKENLEINMLSESLVVFLEVASRLGSVYGALAHDESVCPLRPVAQSGTGPSHSTIIQRFNAFKSRHETRETNNGVVLDWMAQVMSKWDPSWATRKVTGDPADALSIDTSAKMFAQSDVAIGDKSLLMVKGQPSKGSLRGVAAGAQSKGIRLTGIAVGEQYQEVARTMFPNTQKARDLHDLRELLLKQMLAQIESAPVGN